MKIDFEKAADEFLKIVDIRKFVREDNLQKLASMSPLEKTAVLHVRRVPRNLGESLYNFGKTAFEKRAEKYMIESSIRDYRHLRGQK